MQSLAVKYRPKTFDDVVEQSSIKVILEQQLSTGTFKHAYLFCGGAGTGKTTCARIFANEINKNSGNPIEIDAASNNGVDDVREIIQQAKTKSLDSEYKVFIIDECHSLSNTAWQAMLKLIEEPPAKSIFIFCTTDPQKIPKTILSRVQRYDFQRISHNGIVNRLDYIVCAEYGHTDAYVPMDSLDYIAKIADGGMRDAITLMDKCLSYSNELTLDNVVKALGVTDYDTMFKLNDSFFDDDKAKMIEIIENIHKSGIELKQFIKQYMYFALDIGKYEFLRNFKYLHIPKIYEEELSKYGDYEYEKSENLLSVLIKINADIKWENSPKNVIEAMLLEFMIKEAQNK